MIVSDGSASTLDAGVIGVGSMGRNHVRVLSESLDVTLVGVCDTDQERAKSVAAEYGTRAMSQSLLLAVADIVVVAVPTPYHADVVRECIDRGVDVLVEKPFVDDPSEGRELVALAREASVTIQVGHVERFNPVMDVLVDLVPTLDVISVDIKRLGPPLDRAIHDTVVMDLMVHDIDILRALMDEDVASLAAVAYDEQHVAAQFAFESGTIASLTASRLTQEKVRRCSVTAHSCWVDVDFIDQTIEIHRRSVPEFITKDGDVQYRHESVVERPTITYGEPLKRQFAAFVAAVESGEKPVVTAEDALETLAVASTIESLALDSDETVELETR